MNEQRLYESMDRRRPVNEAAYDWEGCEDDLKQVQEAWTAWVNKYRGFPSMATPISDANAHIGLILDKLFPVIDRYRSYDNWKNTHQTGTFDKWKSDQPGKA